MDLSGTNQTFDFRFPPDKESYAWSTFVCGNSGSGKTRFCVDLCKKCLDGPEKDKRQFIYISNEFYIDETLKPLKADKYRDYFQGVDISEHALTESGKSPLVCMASCG